MTKVLINYFSNLAGNVLKKLPHSAIKFGTESVYMYSIKFGIESVYRYYSKLLLKKKKVLIRVSEENIIKMFNEIERQLAQINYEASS